MIRSINMVYGRCYECMVLEENCRKQHKAIYADNQECVWAGLDVSGFQ